MIPPFTDLRSVQTLVDNDKLADLRAQDLSQHDSGAYTGDVSGGRSWPLAARSWWSATPSGAPTITRTTRWSRPAAAAFRHGLTPIVCIGEQLEVREAGNHVEFNVNSLRGSLAGLTKEQFAGIVIAYEPVWAIGTGRVASAADAQEVCAAIRAELANLANPQIAAGVRVLYGGSVNARTWVRSSPRRTSTVPLVGGASLDAEQFATLSAIAAGAFALTRTMPGPGYRVR